MSPGGRVIVVGSVNVDLVVTADRLPAPGETVIGGRFARHHGGKGGNQAVAAARLGAPTTFVGAVGDDDLGASARSALAAEGIDLPELATLPGVATGVALILVDAAGENSIAVAGGANAAIGADAVSTALGRIAPRPGDVVLVGHEIPTAAAVAALRAGRSAGATTILNPAPPDELPAEALALADVLTPNRSEAMRLGRVTGEAGAAAEAVASALRARMGPDGAVLLTLGAEGALLVTPQRRIRLEAPLVDAVDTVGAGDTLNGALAAGLARGLDLESAAREAVVAASMAVTRAGAREGMPTIDELRAGT